MILKKLFLKTAQPMTIPSMSSLLPWATALALLVAALPVSAQNAPAAPTAIGLSHDSVLSRYKRFEDPPVLPWREANDTVGRIGGWKAYAQEKAEGTTPNVNPNATPNATVTQPAPSGHQGHHTPRQP